MSKLIDHYTATTLDAGDVMASTVTCHITLIDWDTKTVYVRVYQCPYPDPQLSKDGIPQGRDVFPHEAQIAIARGLYPILHHFTVKVL